MAEENWEVSIPGDMVFRNGTLTPFAFTTSQTNSISGHRHARKSRSGNWDRKRPKVLEPTPYDLTYTATRMPVGRTQLRYPQWNVLQSYEGCLQMGTPPWQSQSAKTLLQNEALIDALQRLKDQKFNAGVAMAEASGLANMATDAMRGISTVRRKLRGSDLKGAYDAFRRGLKPYMDWETFKEQYGASLGRAAKFSRVPNSWLYYHFGIKPTITDLAGAHEEWFRRHMEPGANTWKATVRGQAKRRERVVGPWSTSHYCWTPEMAMDDVESMRVYLTVTPKDEFLARLAQLGATNVPEAAWNGIPFSWLVDYFTSFGDWLSVLDAGMGYQFGDTVESYRRKTEYRCNHFAVNPSTGAVGETVATPFRGRKTVLNRRVVAEMYPPMFRVIARQRVNGPSLKQFSNMLSVLSGLFGRGTPKIRI